MPAAVLLAALALPRPAAAMDLFTILGGQRVGTSAMTFLKIPVGARAEAMGGAYVAVANGAFASYWNPAGIAQISNRWAGRYTHDPTAPEPGSKGPPGELQQMDRGGRALGVMRNNWIADITYDWIAFTQPLPRGVLGVTAASLTMADMEKTTEFLPDGTGEYFSYSDALFGLTYALPMTENFSWGLTLKYAREQLAEHTMDNVMLDLGTYYWTGWRDLRLGVALVHFGPQAKPDGSYTNVDVNGEEFEDEFNAYAPPTEFRLGAAMTLLALGPHRLLGAVQLNHPVDNVENLKLGGEYSLLNMVFLRAGWKLGTDEDDFTLGGGVRVPMGPIAVSADYSYTDFGILDRTQRFTLGINF